MKLFKSSGYVIYFIFLPMLVSGQPDWHPQTSPVSNDLLSVSFADPLNGWAVGFTGDTPGLRLHTIDGGLSWSVQFGINVIGAFTSLHFRDTERGDFCGPAPSFL